MVGGVGVGEGVGWGGGGRGGVGVVFGYACLGAWLLVYGAHNPVLRRDAGIGCVFCVLVRDYGGCGHGVGCDVCVNVGMGVVWVWVRVSGCVDAVVCVCGLVWVSGHGGV